MWDPVHVAWRAAHPDDSLEDGSDCARCADAAGIVKVSDVVSRNFTAWDTWQDIDANYLCRACTWGYRTRDLRADTLLASWRVDRPLLRRLEGSELFALLRCEPLEAQSLISLPLRAGRRHVLPVARFGHVCVDGTNITWSHGDARRLELVQQLRTDGVSWRAFTEPAPPWRAVSTSPEPTRIMDAWDELSAWRASGVWLEAALAATHPQRTPELGD